MPPKRPSAGEPGKGKPTTPHFLRPEPGETRLAAFLREEGLTGGDVVRLSGGHLSRETVYRLAKGMGSPTLGQAAAIAQALLAHTRARSGHGDLSLAVALDLLFDLERQVAELKAAKNSGTYRRRPKE